MQVKERTNVVQSNFLLENRPKFTKDETRLFLTIVASVNKDDEDFKPIEIPVSEFADLWRMDSDAAYRKIKEALRGLVQKEFFIEGINKKTGKTRFLSMSYVSMATYEEGEGYATVEISQAFKPYLIALKKNYTQYVLENILNLTTVNAIRNYELLKQYESIGKRSFTITEYKKMLGIEEKYSLNADLKRYVLEPAVEEINANTDILVSYDFVGRGTKARIDFKIKKQKIEAKALKSDISRETKKIIFEDENGEEHIIELAYNEIISFDCETGELKIEVRSDEELRREKELEKEFDRAHGVGTAAPEVSAIDYGSVQMNYLANACNREFSVKDMEEIFEILKTAKFDVDLFDLNEARYDFLKLIYTKLEVRAERSDLEPLVSRAGFFKDALKREIVKRDAIATEMAGDKSKITPFESSFDTDDFFNAALARSYREAESLPNNED